MPARTCSEQPRAGPSTHAGPPSYESLQAERDLKESFAQLSRDHEEIQGLFKKVAAQLESTPKIGDEHELCREWNALFKRHRKLYRDSQLNASQCASFLNNYATVLVPLSSGGLSAQEKKLMINKFVEAIPAHQAAAKRTAARFHDLGKQVEVFPIKVSSYLRGEADKGSWITCLLSNVEELFLSLWNVLHSLLTAIIRMFNSMLSHVGAIRFSCSPFITVDVILRNPPQKLSEEPSTGSTLSSTKRDCEEIGDRLYGFEDAWHMVRLACTNLLENVDMAGQVSSVPDAANANLEAAQIVYYPLVHCLRAYASGKSPFLVLGAAPRSTRSGRARNPDIRHWKDNSASKKPCPIAKALNNYMHPRTDPVVIILTVSPDNTQILLGRNRNWPKNFYSALAGFVEPGESLEDTVERELWEEAGIKMLGLKYHSTQPWPFPANVMAGFYAVADPAEPVRTDLDNELEDARWYTREQVLAVLAGTAGKPTEAPKWDSAAEESNASQATEPKSPDEPPFKGPPPNAMAGVLIREWAEGKVDIGMR